MIAADGCLSGNGRSVIVTAKDRQFLDLLRDALGLRCCIGQVNNGRGLSAHRLQIGSKALYEKLLAVGLTPRKSLTIGPLAVPDQRFADFLRGVIDGDGNIRSWRHPTNGREQWAVRVYGASEPFIRWLQVSVERLWHVRGFVYHRHPKNKRHHTLYTLKYGKLAARAILTKCYTPGALALERKRTIAAACVAGSVGWAKSKTVLDRKLWRGWRYKHVWEGRRADTTNPNVDASSGLVKEPEGVWAGVVERFTRRT